MSSQLSTLFNTYVVPLRVEAHRRARRLDHRRMGRAPRARRARPLPRVAPGRHHAHPVPGRERQRPDEDPGPHRRAGRAGHRDDLVRRPDRRGRHRHRRRVGRPALELRRRHLPDGPAAVQGGRLHPGRRHARHGEGDRPVRDGDRHAGQRPDVRRQRQALLGHDPELHHQPVPPRRVDGADRAQREAGRRDPAACGRAWRRSPTCSPTRHPASRS